MEVPGFRDWGLGLGFLGVSWGLGVSGFSVRCAEYCQDMLSLEALGVQEQRGIIAATAALPKLVDNDARRMKHRY